MTSKDDEPNKKKKRGDDLRAREAKVKRDLREAATDIGAIPDIVDWDRRELCRHDFAKFCKTYLSDVFGLSWSESHMLAIKRIEQSVLGTGYFAFAMPRGSGKSSLSRAAVLWAILYGHSSYTYLIGANAQKGNEALDVIKVWLQFNDLLLEDFPETCYPIRKLEGISQRAQSQKCGGVPTNIEWKQERIVLAAVPMPRNHPEYEEGKPAKVSNAIIGVSGLDGSSIRGSAHALTSGLIIRPDFVILDDVQTDQSAKSPMQCDDREMLINAAVLKMAGPGKTLRAIFPCTIIRDNDLACRILDKKRNARWRGEVTKLMPSMPKNTKLWDRYFQVYERCLLSDDLNFKPANDFYINFREELEEGAHHSWPERYEEHEVCAIQNAMHQYFIDSASFFSEMQNEPLDNANRPVLLSVEEIMEKQTMYGCQVVPDDAVYITGHIDVHKNVLYYALAAWNQYFTGQIIDYGTYPDQDRRMFAHRDVKKTLKRASQFGTEEEWIFDGLMTLKERIMYTDYMKPDGSMLYPNLVPIDRGYKPDVVETFCRDYGEGVFIPMIGVGVKAKQKSLTDIMGRDILLKGFNWLKKNSAKYKKVPVLYADVNFYKTFVHERLLTSPGANGCLSLFNVDNPKQHEMIANHLRSEEYEIVTAEGTGRSSPEWEKIPNRDNHFFDNVVGCTVAASVLGISLPNVKMEVVETEKKLKRIKRVSYEGSVNSIEQVAEEPSASSNKGTRRIRRRSYVSGTGSDSQRRRRR